MSIDFSAQKDFQDALEEIHIFLNLAKENVDNKNSNLFLRASVLFLATKLECFFEDIVSEYIYAIENLSLTASQLPESMILAAIDNHFSEERLARIKHKNPLCKDDLSKVVPFIDGSIPITKLDLDLKFSYGKHGSGNVEKLFSRIGVDNLFNLCTIEIYRESMLSEENEVVKINAKNDFDSLTGIRNGIIHENKSPNITIERLEKYVDLFDKFVNKVSEALRQEFSNF